MIPALPNKPLAQEVIAVTAASRGFGYAIAKTLGLAGASVITIDAESEACRSIAAELEGLGVTSVPIKADVSTLLDVELMFSKVSALFGSLTGLVHVAAGSSHTEYERLQDWEWSELFADYVKSSHFLLQGIMRHTSSAWATIVLPPQNEKSPQIASLRGALSGLIKALASKGLRVNGLTPSRLSSGLQLDTPLAQAVLALSLPDSRVLQGSLLDVVLPPAPTQRFAVPGGSGIME